MQMNDYITFSKFIYFCKKTTMDAIVIQTDRKNTRILKELAKKLGANVFSINEEQYEDLALGLLMEQSKTGENASRDSILKQLEKK